MKTPQQPRGRKRRRGATGANDHEATTQALAAAVMLRVGEKGKRGPAPTSGGPATAAAGDRLAAANRRRGSRVRTGDS
jgi:hypothetical protein